MGTRDKLEEVLQRQFGDSEGFSLQFDNSAPDQITAELTSGDFVGKREYERQNLIWDVLDRELTEQQRSDILLIVANTPEESDALRPDEPRDAR